MCAAAIGSKPSLPQHTPCFFPDTPRDFPSALPLCRLQDAWTGKGGLIPCLIEMTPIPHQSSHLEQLQCFLPTPLGLKLLQSTSLSLSQVILWYKNILKKHTLFSGSQVCSDSSVFMGQSCRKEQEASSCLWRRCSAWNSGEEEEWKEDKPMAFVRSRSPMAQTCLAEKMALGSPLQCNGMEGSVCERNLSKAEQADF